MSQEQARQYVTVLLLELDDAEIQRLFVEQLMRLVSAAEEGLQRATSTRERHELTAAKLRRTKRLAAWTAFRAATKGGAHG